MKKGKTRIVCKYIGTDKDNNEVYKNEYYEIVGLRKWKK